MSTYNPEDGDRDPLTPAQLSDLFARAGANGVGYQEARVLCALRKAWNEAEAPIPMILTCPSCNTRHVDRGRFAVSPHHTHACQGCGMCWRPAIVATVGVSFLPGFKDPVGVE